MSISMDATEVKVGSNVEVVSLIGKATRSFGGESSTVAVGDKGVVSDIFGKSASGRVDDYRVVSMNATGKVLWEANFARSELQVLPD